MFLGLDAKFYAEAGRLIDDCIDLALTYHCSPLEFLRLPSNLIDELIEKTSQRLSVINRG